MLLRPACMYAPPVALPRSLKAELAEVKSPTTTSAATPKPEPEPDTYSFAVGVVVPNPTNPALFTINVVFVLDPIANAGAEPFDTVGLIESCAHGVVVPIPRNPVKNDVLVDVEISEPTVS